MTRSTHLLVLAIVIISACYCPYKVTCFSSTILTRNHRNILIQKQPSFSTTTTTSLAAAGSDILLPKPEGCASTPYKKKKIALVGGGGYLGGLIFGFLQRSSSLYGTGITSPRLVCSTAVSSLYLNKLLGSKFVLAYAGEDMVRLTNLWKDVDHIAERIKGYNSIIIGTCYQLESRPITPNTYEQGPNAKTVECYLDKANSVGVEISSKDNGDEYVDINLSIFQNILAACKQCSTIEHIFVVETPITGDAVELFTDELNKIDIPFTYIQCQDELQNIADYTYLKGIQSEVSIQSSSSLEGMKKKIDGNDNNNNVVYREDFAAVIVQCLQSLDWSKSRYVQVSSKNGHKLPITSSDDDNSKSARKIASSPRPDKEWCVNSNILAKEFANVQ